MERVGLCKSSRLGVTVCATLMCMNLFFIRVHMSISVLCMVKDTSSSINDDTIAKKHNTEVTSDAPDSSEITPSITYLNDPVLGACEGQAQQDNYLNLEGEFYWSKSLQAIILSAYYLGYITSQILLGYLAERYGPRHVVGSTVLIGNTANIVIPACAKISPYLVVALRALVGLGHGSIFPGIHCLFGKWAPKLERSILMGATYAGTMLASSLAFGLTGIMCSISMYKSWTLAFYVYGAFSYFCLILWYIFVYNTPSSHPRISYKEANFIEQSVGVNAYGKVSTPWKSIFTSRAMWAITIAQFCDSWCLFVVLSTGPVYMKEVLHFNIQTNGLLTASPFLVIYVVMNISGNWADCLIRKRILNTTNARKFFQILGFLFPGVFIVAVGFVTCQQRYLATALLALSVLFQAFGKAGYFINHVDIAPRYAGLLFGITNALGTMTAIVSPYVVTALTPNGTREEWQIVFFISGAMYMFGLVVYLLFGSGEEQPWAQVTSSADVKASTTNLPPSNTLRGDNEHVCDLANSRELKSK